MGYEQDIRLEHKFAKTIAAILGAQFFTQSVEADLHEATDFLIFRAEPIKIGARLRTNRYLAKYKDEFTIRWQRPSGVPTEIDKIREGLVDYIFYGFVDSPEQHIEHYFIGDLGVFRTNEPDPVAVKWNDPPDSALAAYRVADLPAEFIVKRWPNAH